MSRLEAGGPHDMSRKTWLGGRALTR